MLSYKCVSLSSCVHFGYKTAYFFIIILQFQGNVRIDQDHAATTKIEDIAQKTFGRLT